jgi:hypothetical protein
MICLIGLVIPCVAADDPPTSPPSKRVSFDALVWSTAHFYRFGEGGLYANEFAFERVMALVEVTGSVGRVASAHVSVDVGSVQPQDLQFNLRWGNEFGLRAGQFLLPLGMDVMTEPGELPLVTNSLMASFAKPNGPRDIGFLASWERPSFSLAVATINGAGANSADNNDRKDLCGRAALRPFRNVQLEMALRAYLGWPGSADSVWKSVAGEVALDIGRFVAQAEFQGHSYSDVRNSAGYCLLRYRAGLVEPCGRIEFVTPRGRRPDVMLMGGPSINAINSHIKVTLDGFYRRNYQVNSTVYGFVFRLQAEI